MWWEPRAVRLIYIQSVGTYPKVGASLLMTKYDNEWDTVVPDPSLVSASPDPRLLITTLLDRILQHDNKRD